MSAEDTEYERFVRSITEALLRAQGLETVSVQHDVKVKGTSRSHQIDVYWEYRLGGVLHRVIINCKRYAATVAVTDVLTLSGVLQDMPGVRGVIVTTVGFQKGAVDYATQHQIGLKVIRPPQDSDWKGRLRRIKTLVRIHEPELISCFVELDKEWVATNVGPADETTGAGVNDAQTTIVRDAATGSVEDMNAMWNRAMRENPTPDGNEGAGIVRWDNAFFEASGRPPLKVNAIEFKWRFNVSEVTTFTVQSEPTAIVRDAIAGTLLFVDPNGQVTGDVEAELGQKKQ